MTGKTNFCQAVPLVIHHDWTQTINRMKKLLPLKEHTKSESHGNATHFLMKSLGTLSEHQDSKSWYRFAGSSIEQTMPWIDDLLSHMRELDPDDSCISFLDGTAAAHVDLSDIPSALNYIFYNTDTNAHTWLRDGSITETYPSTVGSAWIIDTQKEHGIVNDGIRYSLSIHFKADYQTTKKWFDNQTQSSLTFGS
jgi:hypothetical protein